MFNRLQAKFLGLPISSKIIGITAFSSFVTLSLICAISFYRDWKAFADRTVEGLDSLAQILESNTEASLRFNDPYRAKEYVDSLSNVKGLLSVTIYNDVGIKFASFATREDFSPFPSPRYEGERWEDGRVFFARTITLDDTRMGKILIEMDTSEFKAATWQSFGSTVALFLGGLFATVFLAAWLQRSFTHPLKELLDTTKRVTDSESYTHRATKRLDDEIGSLVDSFNDMLDALHRRDDALKDANSSLERTVAERTADLQSQNEALREAIEAAKAASIAKSEFLATTSHELRTPLNPIIGYVEMLLLKGPPEEDAQQLTLIKQSAEQLLRLIDDILDFSRIERGAIQLASDEVRIASLCQGVVDLMSQEALRKNLSLKHEHEEPEDLKPNQRIIKTDEGRLRQVVLNLVNNSIKFTHEGTIVVRSRISRRSESNGIIRIDVTDTGIGISTGDQDKLFKPFSQIDGSLTREYGGMGLGLAISKKIIDAMKGDLICSSQVDVGSTFTFTIPIEFSEGLAQKGAKKDDTKAKKSIPAEILLVEDEAVNRELVRSLLVTFGHSVTCARDGVEAVELWNDSNQDFDLVLLDISMPRLDGFATSKALRKTETQGRRVPIVAMTAHARPSDRQKCIDCGMDDYLSKPLSLPKLSQTLDRWIRPNKAT
ncbi:MAG: ATP-binding protein [Verrucomicrobiota bacterium]